MDSSKVGSECQADFGRILDGCIIELQISCKGQDRQMSLFDGQSSGTHLLDRVSRAESMEIFAHGVRLSRRVSRCTLPKTHIDPDVLVTWKIVGSSTNQWFSLVFRVHVSFRECNMFGVKRSC